MDDPTTWEEVSRHPDLQVRGTKLRLAQHLKMDPSYLSRKLGTRSDLKVSEAKAVKEFLSGDVPAEAPAGRRVPIYGYASMGAADIDDEGDHIAVGTGDILDWMELPAGLNPRGECFVIHPIGSSMEPRIFEGEPLLVLRNSPPLRAGDALIEFSDGTGVVKIYEGTRDGRVWARQFNPAGGKSYPATRVAAVHRIIRL